MDHTVQELKTFCPSSLKVPRQEDNMDIVYFSNMSSLYFYISAYIQMHTRRVRACHRETVPPFATFYFAQALSLPLCLPHLPTCSTSSTASHSLISNKLHVPAQILCSLEVGSGWTGK